MMMVSAAMTVPVTMVTGMLERLRISPDGQSDAVGRAGIAPVLLGQPAARVTVEQFSLFYRALVLQFDDETPGFFSRPLRSGTLKFLCLGLLGAPTLSVALHRFSCFFRLVLDDVLFHLQDEDGSVAVVLEERQPLGPQRVLVLELMLLLVQGIASWLVERHLRFVRVDLAYPPPAHAGEYPNMYAGPICFDQPVTRLMFEHESLRWTVRQDQTAVTAFLRRAPIDWIRPSISERLVTHQVRDLLESHLAWSLSAVQVAEMLHFSPRTLARRLAVEGTHFHALKCAVRRDVAIVRLLSTKCSVASIAAELGFEDPAAFNRAFRQWAGMSPGGYRKGRRPGKSAWTKLRP